MALFNCPKCSWRVKITEKDLGKKGKCLQCAHEFVFPSKLPKDVPAAAEKPPPVSALPSRSAQTPAWLKGVALTAALIIVVGIFGAIGYFTLGGSSPAAAVVVGTVTYNEKPLTSGSITFQGDNGIRQASIGKDGSYLITDDPLGPVKISVRNVTSFMKKLKGDKIKWETKSLIPTKYNDPERSGLNFIVGNGRQQIPIDLKD